MQAWLDACYSRWGVFRAAGSNCARLFAVNRWQKLRAAFAQHPHIGDIRGRGLFHGLEIVEDRETKAPFDPARGVNKAIKAAAMDAGLLCYPMGGTIDGKRGDHVLLAPPFILEEAQLDELVDKLGRAFRAVLG